MRFLAIVWVACFCLKAATQDAQHGQETSSSATSVTGTQSIEVAVIMEKLIAGRMGPASVTPLMADSIEAALEKQDHSWRPAMQVTHPQVVAGKIGPASVTPLMAERIEAKLKRQAGNWQPAVETSPVHLFDGKVGPASVTPMMAERIEAELKRQESNRSHPVASTPRQMVMAVQNVADPVGFVAGKADPPAPKAVDEEPMMAASSAYEGNHSASTTPAPVRSTPVDEPAKPGPLAKLFQKSDQPAQPLFKRSTKSNGQKKGLLKGLFKNRKSQPVSIDK